MITEDMNSDYMLGEPTYKWLKNVISKVYYNEFPEKNRMKTLIKRKKELNLKEYQNLYDYWNFFSKNGKIEIANNPSKNYLSVTKDWIWYLTMCQLFEEELKNGSRTDIYTNMYNEIISLPPLTGDMEKDLIILQNSIREYFFKSKSPTRNGLMLYHNRFRREDSLF